MSKHFDYRGSLEAAAFLAAIVDASEDAILTKDLHSIITSWNGSASRLFGYTAEEMIGQSVTVLIPADKQEEEYDIISRIRRGERIEHYETVRRRKDGSLIDISLTVSPIKNADGVIIGASKIARDITDRRRAREINELLIKELEHRLKNQFSLIISLINLSARFSDTPNGLAAALTGRLSSLAFVYSLTTPKTVRTAPNIKYATMLRTLITTVLAPFIGPTEVEKSRLKITGADVPLSDNRATSFALLFYEFATNSVKFGALSQLQGQVDINFCSEDNLYIFTWKERGGPSITAPPRHEGFGSKLARLTVESTLKGELRLKWDPEGLTIRFCFPESSLAF